MFVLVFYFVDVFSLVFESFLTTSSSMDSFCTISSSVSPVDGVEFFERFCNICVGVTALYDSDYFHIFDNRQCIYEVSNSRPPGMSINFLSRHWWHRH